jgi:hypothetical protein
MTMTGFVPAAAAAPALGSGPAAAQLRPDPRAAPARATTLSLRTSAHRGT